MAVYFGVMALVLLIAFWMASMRAREKAIVIAKKACQQKNWPWLDDSVALKKIRLRRGPHSLIAVWREYQFEHGVDQRHAETVIVCGHQAWLEGGDIELEAESHHDDNKTAEPKSNVIQFPKKAAND